MRQDPDGKTAALRDAARRIQAQAAVVRNDGTAQPAALVDQALTLTQSALRQNEQTLRDVKEASDKLYAGVNPLTAEDHAEVFWWIANLPPHININTIELMPVNQSFAGFAVHREG